MSRPATCGAASAAVLAAAHRRMGDSAQPELLRSQVEISTPVCATLEEVAAELARLRLAMGAAAAEKGCRLGAAGTHPFARWGRQSVTDSRATWTCSTNSSRWPGRP